MHIPKRYGQSKEYICPFCESKATTVNKQGIPVCIKHKTKELQNIRCVCGCPLEIRKGKFGAYCYCMDCGNLNLKKVLEINEVKNNKKDSNEKKEITITSDDPNYF